jgi:hypothetical protein
MALPTRWKLACALIAAELYDMADRAVVGYYDDYLSPLDAPISALVAELAEVGTPAALLVRGYAMAGDFDATEDEAIAWAQTPEGQKTFAAFMKNMKTEH